MRKKIQLVLLLLKYNWKSLLGFELLYKLLGGAIVVPLIYGMSQWIMKITGYHYLTLENLKRFLKNPFTLAAFVAVLLAVCLYLMSDASALLFLAAHSYEREKVTVLHHRRPDDPVPVSECGGSGKYSGNGNTAEFYQKWFACIAKLAAACGYSAASVWNTQAAVPFYISLFYAGTL